MVFYRDLKGQSWLFPPDIRDMIPDDHICRLVDGVMDGLDLSYLESRYDGPGHPAYHPRIMLNVLIMSSIEGCVPRGGLRSMSGRTWCTCTSLVC